MTTKMTTHIRILESIWDCKLNVYETKTLLRMSKFIDDDSTVDGLVATMGAIQFQTGLKKWKPTTETQMHEGFPEEPLIQWKREMTALIHKLLLVVALGK